MSRKIRRSLLAGCVLCPVILVGVFMVVRTRGVRAGQEALTDVGRFRVGASVGGERAGFSGLPMLQVFANPDDPGWSELQACLSDPAVETDLSSFTPILIDERVDRETEETFRSRDGLRVVVRELNGKFLGGLRATLRCQELLSLLQSIRLEVTSPEKSPIYARLLETPEPIDFLLQEGKRAQAEKLVAFLREFEGADSPAVAAAESRLNR